MPWTPLRTSATVVALVGAVVLGGCTSSQPSDPNTSWSDLWNPSAKPVTVTLGLDAGTTIPRGFKEAVQHETGVSLRIVSAIEPALEDDLGGTEPAQSGAEAGQSGADAPQDEAASKDKAVGRSTVAGQDKDLSKNGAANTQSGTSDVQSGLEDAQSGAGTSDPELFIGLFPEGDSPDDAQVIGDEDVCVLADLSWYSANNKTAPKNRSDLKDKDLAAILHASDPNTSAAAAAEMPLWVPDLQLAAEQKAQFEALSEEEAAALAEGELPEGDNPEGDNPEAAGLEGGQEAPQSGLFAEAQSWDAPAPGLIGSSLEVIRAQNNVGTSARYQVVSGTCAASDTYLVVAPSASRAAENLAEYFVSEEGQALLGAYALTYPTHGTADSGPKLGREKSAKTYTPAEVQEAVSAWNVVFE